MISSIYPKKEQERHVGFGGHVDFFSALFKRKSPTSFTLTSPVCSTCLSPPSPFSCSGVRSLRQSSQTFFHPTFPHFWNELSLAISE